jgi:hypothetical protein
MKISALFIAALMAVLPSFGFAQSLVKTCKTSFIRMDGAPSIATTIEVFSGSSWFTAKITQSAGGQSSSRNESAAVNFYSVREGLTSKTSLSPQLNMAEALIVSAMNLTQDPIMAGTFQTGVNLKAIRSAHVFVIGKFESMGGLALVEAFDGARNNIGTFVAGTMVAPCKK